MTDGERILWSELKAFRNLYGIAIRRQVPIGPFIADFACHSRKLIVEIDAKQHFTDEGIKQDHRRDTWFANAGYRVLRLTSADVFDDKDACVNTVLAHLGLMN